VVVRNDTDPATTAASIGIAAKPTSRATTIGYRRETADIRWRTIVGGSGESVDGSGDDDTRRLLTGGKARLERWAEGPKSPRHDFKAVSDAIGGPSMVHNRSQPRHTTE
jgi:hypothetical protein